MDHDRYIELLAAHALGALDGEDSRELEAHLRTGCEACEGQIRELEAVASELALLAEPASAPPRLRGELMRRISPRTAPAAPLTGRESAALPTRGTGSVLGWVRPIFEIAAILAIAALGWNSYALQQRVREQQNELAALRGELAQQTVLVNFLATSSVQVANLEGLPLAPAARGRLVWDRSAGSGFFFASHLPVPPQDKTYQLWAIADGKPLSAGVFQVDQGGQGKLRVNPISGAEKAAQFAVTLEPAGGRDIPTLDQMVLRGAL